MNHSAQAGDVSGWNDKSPNQTKRLIASSVALIALSTSFVFLRLVSRKLSKAGFWVRLFLTNIYSGTRRLDGIADFCDNCFWVIKKWDDALIVLALVRLAKSFCDKKGFLLMSRKVDPILWPPY